MTDLEVACCSQDIVYSSIDFDWGPKVVEVCVDSIDSAEKALEGGANMLQLSDGLAIGGLTPSSAFLKWAGHYVGKKVPLFAKISPHSGHFHFSQADVIAMSMDIDDARTWGASGVVFGILDEDRNVDMAKCRDLMDAAASMPVTFSRAFDMTRDPKRSLERLIELGCTRVLTSGCNWNCLNGAELIKELIEQADDRIIVVPAGDIKEDNLELILEATGATEVNVQANVPRHSSIISAYVPEQMEETFGPVYQTCSVQKVKNLVAIAKRFWF